MSFYVDDDCSCGYATHNTESCTQKDCGRYLTRELRMAQIELQKGSNMVVEIFRKRVEKAINRRDN